MVECADESIYIGLTNYIERRIKEHNSGFNDNSYTSKRRPVKLIWHQEFIQFAQAEMFEKKIKKWSRAKKLALANDEYDMLPLLAECRNKSHAKNK
jgi:putative endonuclease